MTGQSLPLEARYRLDHDTFAHNNLVLDDDVNGGVKRRTWRFDSLTTMIRLDDPNSICLGGGLPFGRRWSDVCVVRCHPIWPLIQTGYFFAAIAVNNLTTSSNWRDAFRLSL